MTNAREELLNHIEDKEVEYVIISTIDIAGNTIEGPLEGTLEEVLPNLDFIYDNGYGSQELDGTIWYTDGSWSERVEYDGYEWWEHREKPKIPVK